jgi:D-sedoheptulose 7-phosphate isomerase
MDLFERTIEEHSKLIELLKKEKENILNISNVIKKTISNGNKVLICGNGGSAADSQHMAAELIGRFKKERGALPAISLTTDTSIITSISNDYSFDNIFERQVEGLGKKGDLLIGFSTSGNSRNVIKAFEKAKQIGIKTLAILGKPGILEGISDYSITIAGDTARVQEIHSIIIHIICEFVE